MTEEMVMYDSDRAAKRVTITGYRKEPMTGWMDRFGRYFGDDENLARYSGCTHKTCDCGKPMTKGWLKCEDCRAVSARERYLSLEYVAYENTGDIPVCTQDGNEY